MYLVMNTLLDYLEHHHWQLKEDTEQYWLYSKKDKHQLECDVMIPKNSYFLDYNKSMESAFYNRAMESAFASIANVEGVRAKDIERYASWFDYADEHVCMLRQLEDYVFEAIWAKWDPEVQEVFVRHESIYLEDLKGNSNYVNSVVQAFGYKDMNAYDMLEKPSTADIAALLCEYHSDGIYMEEEKALELIEHLTGAGIKAIPHI